MIDWIIFAFQLQIQLQFKSGFNKTEKYSVLDCEIKIQIIVKENQVSYVQNGKIWKKHE